MDTLGAKDTLKTNYGTLTGVLSSVFYPNGGIAEIELEAFNEIKTPYGVLIPQYAEEDVWRKQIKPLSFHRNGNLASISLQTQQPVQTPVGVIPAEYVLFYESGAIRRIFPLNGKITGFWSEDNDYELAQELEVQVDFGTLKQKFIGIYFYEDGAVKSLTFWHTVSSPIPTPAGMIATRTGVSFHPQGQIKSVEPKHPVLVETPIGKITAFDTSVVGIHGDTNSLCFFPDGRLKSLITSSDRITITDSQGNQSVMQPGLQPSGCNIDVMEIVPLHIEFSADTVWFNHSTAYEFTQHTFTVENHPIEIPNPCQV
jgi:hypothetical protein